MSPTIPFWKGEHPSRSCDLGLAVGRLRRDAADRLDAPGLRRVGGAGVRARRARGRRDARWLLKAGEVLDGVPDDQGIVVESFADEMGGRHAMIHSVFGMRVNGAWGMALREKVRRRFGLLAEASHVDDGILLSFAPGQVPPAPERLRHAGRARGGRPAARRALIGSPLFGTRFRHAAVRALFIPRMTRGQRTPAYLQRLKADALMEAVGGQPEFPIVAETLRECFHDALDVPRLKRLLERLHDGEMWTRHVDTPLPSPFVYPLLLAWDWAYLDAGHAEERRSDAVRCARPGAWRRARSRRHRGRRRGRAAEDDARAAGPRRQRAGGDPRRPRRPHRAEIAARARRCRRADRRPGRRAADRRGRVRGGPARVDPGHRRHLYAALRDRGRAGAPGLRAAAHAGPGDRRGAGRTLRPHAPTSRRGRSSAWSLAASCARARSSRERRARSTSTSRCSTRSSAGRFTRAACRGRWPRPSSSPAFLLRRHHLHPEHRLVGPPGVLAALELLQGEDFPVRVWEQELLPARVEDYQREWLDRLGPRRRDRVDGVRAGDGDAGRPGRRGAARERRLAPRRRRRAAEIDPRSRTSCSTCSFAAPRSPRTWRATGLDAERAGRALGAVLGGLVTPDTFSAIVAGTTPPRATPRATRAGAGARGQTRGPLAPPARDRPVERARRGGAAVARGARRGARPAAARALRRRRARAGARRLGDAAPHVCCAWSTAARSCAATSSRGSRASSTRSRTRCRADAPARRAEPHVLVNIVDPANLWGRWLRCRAATVRAVAPRAAPRLAHLARRAGPCCWPRATGASSRPLAGWELVDLPGAIRALQSMVERPLTLRPVRRLEVLDLGRAAARGTARPSTRSSPPASVPTARGLTLGRVPRTPAVLMAGAHSPFNASMIAPPGRRYGTRVLIMRLWPRGIRKEVDRWLQGAGPGAAAAARVPGGETHLASVPSALPDRSAARPPRPRKSWPSSAARRGGSRCCAGAEPRRCHRTLLQGISDLRRRRSV